jgi:hypothetical protein
MVDTDEEEGGGAPVDDPVVVAEDDPLAPVVVAVPAAAVPSPTATAAPPTTATVPPTTAVTPAPDGTTGGLSRLTLVALAFFVITTLLFAGLFGWAQNNSNNSEGTEEVPSTIDVERARDLLHKFRLDLNPAYLNRTYYPNATLQESQWLVCTIVEQCIVPTVGLAVSLLTPLQKGALFDVLAEVMTIQAYQMLLQQEQANLILGQYQEYATTCQGTCKALLETTAFALWNNSMLHDDGGFTYNTCQGANNNSTSLNATWVCEGVPLGLYGNLNTSEPNVDQAYAINDLFTENMVHPRGDIATYVSVYGSLSGTGPFGLRYSGHHLDLNIRFLEDGTIDSLPAFIGHNPISVLPLVPNNTQSEVGNDVWTNLRGVTLFPQSAKLFYQVFDQVLPVTAFIPLSNFESTPGTGGLTLQNGLDLMNSTDVPNALALSDLDDRTFDTLWELLTYIRTLIKPNPDVTTLFDEFRANGRLIWTSFSETDVPTSAREVISNFGNYYILVETQDHLCFCIVNQMFTFATRDYPSNHFHSLFIPKSYLDNYIPANESQGPDWPSLL